LKTSNDFVA